MTPITLGACVQTFLQEDRSPYTNDQYGLVLRRLVDALGPDCPLPSIEYTALSDYFTMLRHSSARNGRRKGQPLKSSTLRGHMQIIKALFNWAVSVNYIEHSPAAKLRLRDHVEEPNHDSRAMPPGELAAILDAAKYHPRNFAMLLFLADTGCRVGGLCSLTLEHIDLGSRSAMLLEKGSHWHRVLFGEQTAEALQRWLARRPAADHDYAWTGKAPVYKPLSRAAINAIISKLCVRTGASRRWGPHSIRHAVGHAWAKGGAPVSVVQRKLGHSDPTITAKYYFPHDDAYLRQMSDAHALAAVGEVIAAPATPGKILKFKPTG